MPSRAKLDHVVVVLDERHHSQNEYVEVPLAHRIRLKAHTPQQKTLPIGGAELLPPAIEVIQNVPLAQLDRPQGGDGEGPAILLLGNRGVVGQVDLGIEPARQHPLVVADQVVGNAHVLQLQARQCRQVAVGLGIEAGRDNVDDLYRARFAGTGLEQFLFAAANGPVPKLPFNNPQSFLDFLLVDAGTVAAQQEFADVGWHRVLPGEFPHQVFADNVAIEPFGGDFIKMVQFHSSLLPRRRSGFPA